MSLTPRCSRAPALVEHFFRHEFGRLVAVLTRRFGVGRLDAIEDAVQSAFERALGTWPRQGVPDEPAAWLTRVATNRLIDRLRREQRAERLSMADLDEPISPRADEDILAMLFACADEQLAPRARLVLCLKLLCGFSTHEIASRLLMSPANVQKTLERGRDQLARRWAKLDGLVQSATNHDERLSTVLQVLYLLFTEGASLADDVGLRVELCDEAIRLTGLLVAHPIGDRTASWALLALMHLHAARLPARIDGSGELIPLSEQDRGRWDRQHVAEGLASMERATRVDEYTRYHGEAAIQIEHVLAPSFEATRWHEIVSLYRTLEAMQPSPVYALNRAIALAEAEGPLAGLAALDEHAFPPWFARHYLVAAARGELLRRAGRGNDARPFLERAREGAPSHAERLLFSRRLAACESDEE